VIDEKVWFIICSYKFVQKWALCSNKTVLIKIKRVW